VQKVFKDNDLSLESLAGIASISIKEDEQGILDTARELAVPLTFYEKEMLSKVTNIPSPSDMVEKHTGVKSVCEAAAVQAAGGGKLVVLKQKTENVTVAVARRENSISWG
jgi:cobalt-precorrin 5A hydrolase